MRKGFPNRCQYNKGDSGEICDKRDAAGSGKTVSWIAVGKDSGKIENGRTMQKID